MVSGFPSAASGIFLYLCSYCIQTECGTGKTKHCSEKNNLGSTFMFNLLKRLAGMAAAAALATTLVTPSGALARSLDEILSSGTLKVGVNPTLPPLGIYDETNQITGFDVDFSQKLAEILGVELEVVQVGSPDRIPFVASGKIDIVMGAMTRNPERAKVIDFTLPVHTEVFGVLTTEDKGFTDWKELNTPDVTLVQVRGSTPVKFIEENL